MAGTDEKWSVEKLTSVNYTTWKFKLKHLLIAKELWGYIDDSIEEPANEAQPDVKANYKKKSNQAMSTIVLSVSDELLYLITECVKAKETWNKLKAHFERATLSNKLFLKKQYFRMEMQEGSSMEGHLKHMKELSNKLSAINAAISDEDQVVTLLGSLPESYASLVTALETRAGELTLEYVHQALNTEDQRRREQKSPAMVGASGSDRLNSNPDTALIAGRRNDRYHQNKSRTCWECNSNYHIRRDCPMLQTQSGKPNHQAKLAEATGQNYSAFLASDDNNTSNNHWLIDSGATKHMTYDRNSYKEYTSFETPQQVGLGDGHTLDAVGIGTVEVIIQLSRKQKRTCMMYDVLFVPGLKVNLFSVQSAAKKNHVIQFGHSRCWLKTKLGKLSATGTVINNLYYLDTISDNHYATVARDCDVWHKRLGHASSEILRRAHVDGLMLGADLSRVYVDFCEPCVKGKMPRKPFLSNASGIKTTRPLELVHSDLCGPMTTKSIGGSRYFLTFIDDYTRYAFVYFVREKAEVFCKFREFEAFVCNQTGLTIGNLRTDGGGEYVGHDFEQYLVNKGIHHQLTVRYSPQQNGVAERYNRTICESARSMVFEADLSKRFWAEAVATAVYTKNRLPTAAISAKSTPYERWHKTKPDVSHFRVFGCVAYSHIPDQLRGKLDSKAESMVFVGYSHRSKGYRLYDQKVDNVVTRRDVIFNEAKFGTPSVRQTTSDNQESWNVDLHSMQDTAHDHSSEVNTPRRSSRQTAPPVRYGIDDYINHSVSHVACHARDIIEPQNFAEAMRSPESEQWLEAAQAEYKSLIDNDTWELVTLPESRRAIDSKWVFKAKYDKDGIVDRFKGRLVARGFEQKAGIDYEETYAPVVKYPSLRALLSYAVSKDMVIHQMDVVTAFLNGHLEEEIFMKQPVGFIKSGQENLVCKLKKSLYGLKQAPRCWNAVLDKYLKSIRFLQSPADQCVYVRNDKDIQTIIAVYVDDLVVMSDDINDLQNVKRALAGRFQMKDLGDLSYCLGISVQRDGTTMKLYQKNYVEQLLKTFGMDSCNPVTTPSAVDVKLVKSDGSRSVDPVKYQSIIGSLLYLAMATRPDIAHSVGVLSKFNSCPSETHLTAAKRVIRYLKGTADYGIVYGKSGSDTIGYTDASWGDDNDDRHSTTGVVFLSSGGPINWLSKRQTTVALSTAESEYIALFEGTKEAVWLRQLYNSIGQQSSTPLTIRVDNTSADAIANNSKSSKRVKHMDIKYHFVREAIADKAIATSYCSTECMLADILTKSLPRPRFMTLRDMLGVKE